MKELASSQLADRRTVKAWETNAGGYVQVYDVRDLMHGDYTVEVEVPGGFKSIYTASLEKCVARAIKYAEEN